MKDDESNVKFNKMIYKLKYKLSFNATLVIKCTIFSILILITLFSGIYLYEMA
jgi:hypothetical protein